MVRKSSLLYGLVVTIMACAAYSTADWQPMDAARWAWLPGTLFGVVAGTFGGVSGTLAPKGRARSTVLTAGALLLAASAGMLVGGIVLLAMGRSWYLWYMWMLPGGLGCFILPQMLRRLRRVYDQAELRRLSAKDMTSA